MTAAAQERKPDSAPSCLAAVGERIRLAREAAGIGQRGLAALAYATQTKVSYWEQGKRDPGVDGIVRVARALEIPVGSLLPGGDATAEAGELLRRAQEAAAAARLRAAEAEAESGRLRAILEGQRECGGEMERLLAPAQVCAVFGVDPKTVTRWAQSGLITSVRTPGGHRRYRESEVRALLKGTGEAGAPS